MHHQNTGRDKRNQICNLSLLGWDTNKLVKYALFAISGQDRSTLTISLSILIRGFIIRHPCET